MHEAGCRSTMRFDKNGDAMDNYPEGTIFGNKDVTFHMYCHNKQCDMYNKVTMRDGFTEMETGWGEPYDPNCNACDQELYSWKDTDEG